MRLAGQPAPPPGSRRVALLLGLGQMIAWGVSYYLPAVIAETVVRELGASPALVYGAFSLSLLLSGLAAPHVGRLAERYGAPVLLRLSALVLAAGLLLLAVLPGIWGWMIGWVVLGFGMALGLYEPAFATLAMLYGQGARRLITMVTLLGGFASTLAWPLTSALLPLMGWRNACLLYAAACLLLLLPLYLALPGGVAAGRRPGGGSAPPPLPPTAWARRAFLLLAAFFTLRALISTTMSTHLITLMAGLGLPLAAAVGTAALMGPAQVGGRALEFLFGRRAHPLAVTWIGAALLPLAAVTLLFGPAASLPFVLLYGASNGIITISRGALPLALFGERGYPALMGRLALPVLLAQGAAPIITAPLVKELPALTMLGLVGAVGVLAMLCLIGVRPAPTAHPTAQAGPAGPAAR